MVLFKAKKIKIKQFRPRPPPKRGEMCENVGKCGKMWENVGKCVKMCENVGKCGKMWENVGKCGETGLKKERSELIK